jgi:diguanylate cyclase (GGDEF)-like protein
VSLLHHTSKITSLLALGALCLVLVRMTLTLRSVQDVEKASFAVARVDELTGLCNRRAFFENGETRFGDLKGDQRVGVIIVDLVDFKEINDTLGHAAGDELLRVVAMRFVARAAGRGTVARIGGDEFACLYESVSIDEIVAFARELATSLGDPCVVDGVPVRVGGSFGVAISPEHGTTLSELLRCADVAMYAAKSTHTQVRLFAREDDRRVRNRLALVDDLRTTPWERQLVLHYQPTLDLHTGAFRGVEALVRWRHPTLGLLYPDDFVELTEQTGFIHALTAAVLDLAVAELRQLDRDGWRLQMSVNVSRFDLYDDELPGVIDAVLDRHGVSADRLTLEITETAFSGEPQRVAESIERLRSRGIRVSIDDFGVGYSSLSQLLHLPVDELKIDKSFSLALGVDPRARAVVTATVDLARALGLSVVAEGIESPLCLRAVRELGVDVAQGYHVACPFTSRQLSGFLDERRATDLDHFLATNH